jgi:hypothetical protein
MTDTIMTPSNTEGIALFQSDKKRSLGDLMTATSTDAIHRSCPSVSSTFSVASPVRGSSTIEKYRHYYHRPHISEEPVSIFVIIFELPPCC